MGKSSRTKHSHREPARKTPRNGGGRRAGWWAQNGPIVRFVGLFLGLLVAFQVAYYELIVPSAFFRAYLGASSRIAAALLNLLGENVTASGDVLSSTFSMSIKSGCDGLQAMAILAIAVLAFPGGGPKKLLAVAGGIGLIGVLNLLRLVTLFWAGVHAPGMFQTMHVHVWPAFLIFVALVYSLGWASLSRRPPRVA